MQTSTGELEPKRHLMKKLKNPSYRNRTEVQVNWCIMGKMSCCWEDGLGSSGEGKGQRVYSKIALSRPVVLHRAMHSPGGTLEYCRGY